MNFFKYLKDQWTLILGWLFFIALTIFVMWLAPNIKVDLSTIAYLALIEGIFLIFYLLGGYLSKRRWWGKLADIQKTSPLQNYLSGGRTEEEKLVEEYINQLIREHQEVMQSAINKTKKIILTHGSMRSKYHFPLPSYWFVRSSSILTIKSIPYSKMNYQKSTNT